LAVAGARHARSEIVERRFEFHGWKDIRYGQSLTVFPRRSVLPPLSVMPKKSEVTILPIPMIGSERLVPQSLTLSDHAGRAGAVVQRH
jgi:hypothetical protein